MRRHARQWWAKDRRLGQCSLPQRENEKHECWCKLGSRGCRTQGRSVTWRADVAGDSLIPRVNKEQALPHRKERGRGLFILQVKSVQCCHPGVSLFLLELPDHAVHPRVQRRPPPLPPPLTPGCTSSRALLCPLEASLLPRKLQSRRPRTGALGACDPEATLSMDIGWALITFAFV